MMMNRDDLLTTALELRQLEQAMIDVPIKFFCPQEPDQIKLFDEEMLKGKRIVGILGGNKSGKTFCGVARIIQKCLENKSFCIIATWSNLLKELSKKLYALLPKNELVTYAVYNESNGFVRRSIHFENGSEIVLLTFEQGAERFQSYSCNYILLDEEPPKDIYDECLMRIAHMNGQIMISATPVKGFTYLQQLFQVQAQVDPTIISFNWDSLNNKYNDIGSMKSIFDGMTEEQMRMRRFGEFINQKSGLVFNKFQWDRNVVDHNPFHPAEYNAGLKIIVCVDFNYLVLPMVLMQQYGDKYYVFDTVSQRNGNTETVAQMVRQKYPQAAFDVYCDAAGNANKTSASKTDVNILQDIFQVKIKYRNVKNIKDRTEALNAYLLNARGESRLYIHSRNRELLIDFQTVDWTLYEGNRKQKDRTHHVDALSYYFYYSHAMNFKIRTKML